MPEPSFVTVFDAVQRAHLRGAHTWVGLVAIRDGFEELLGELDIEVQAQVGLSLRVVDVAEQDVALVLTELMKSDEDWVALVGLHNWSPDQWMRLDLNRDTLQRPGPILFCLSPAGADALSRHAPNLRSRLGAFLGLGPNQSSMSDTEIAARLAELRTRYAMEDNELILRASRHELPLEPHYVEWLVLLNRSDLI